MKNWTTVEVLRHARHDWLNKIQLVKGYASLNKLDNIKGIVDEIIQEARQESMLSNLNLPQFAELLLTYNWRAKYFQIEYEILNVDASKLPNDETLSNWMSHFLERLEKAISNFGDNQLYIRLDTSTSVVRFNFEFSGTINNIEMLDHWFKEQGEDSIVVHHLTPSAFEVDVLF
ncbi:sporulation protein [Bacillus ginsengihumi]|uniref:Sporulation protein n=1 Tax=Heyndrickxia ginsengihumi TaxID=363870 RepID=A0A0A6VJT6_9BACI|nr:Spo0B C-terminal domain-containing protein [Heyndrickxia ginsengihumi]KHD86869.1 sporulation protein [Heyndrickxia ginsengihumi]MBE6184155.1 sporulation protein [Bacillus sp. (in: firmicutes)]MCM3021872.1 sporulation initiation phosphotransferase B [Heyndrickxia ginsengihumi]NEY20441.1 sporulation protein [Heyndrickxia ginsengihumi]